MPQRKWVFVREMKIRFRDKRYSRKQKGKSNIVTVYMGQYAKIISNLKFNINKSFEVNISSF